MSKLFNNQSKVKVFQHNIDNDPLNYADDYFDTAVMTSLIEHFVDPINALKLIYRVLKPVGRLIIDTPNIAKWTRRIKLLLGYFPSTASHEEGLTQYRGKTQTDLHDEGHLHYFSFRSLTRLCKERAGFSRCEWFGYGNWRANKSPLFLARTLPTIFSDVFIVAYKG